MITAKATQHQQEICTNRTAIHTTCGISLMWQQVSTYILQMNFVLGR